MAIVLTCRCGKRFDVHDKFAGKPFPCPACAEVLQVPPLAARVPAPLPRKDAVYSGPPRARTRSAAARRARRRRTAAWCAH